MRSIARQQADLCELQLDSGTNTAGYPEAVGW